MKTILICPSQNTSLAYLTESCPPVALPMLGENFLTYWLQHLAGKNIREVRLLVTDRPDDIRKLVGDGSRWGLAVEVIAELREFDAAEARKVYKPAGETDWAPEPDDVIRADSFPGMSGQNMFESYADWFKALTGWMPRMMKERPLGMKEIEPGVWVGRRTRIAPTAKLIGPCWIGDHAKVGADSIIGPHAYLEDRVVAEEACEIRDSWVGPDTFIGKLIRVQDSLAWGSALINWKTGSCLRVPDAFLMCSLARKEKRARRLSPKRLAEVVQAKFNRPLDAVLAMKHKLQS